MGERRRFRQGEPTLLGVLERTTRCSRGHVLLQRCVVVVVTEQRPSLSCGVVVPQHRRLLYDLFTRNYRVKRSAVQARLAQEFGDVSKAEVDRLFHVSDASGVELASA